MRKVVEDERFDNEDITKQGELKIKKTNKILRIVGGIMFGAGLIGFIYIFLPSGEQYKTIEMMVVLLIIAVIGALLLGFSFIKRDPHRVGTGIFNKEKSKMETALNNQTINPDKIISVKDTLLTEILIQTDLMIFRIKNNTITTKMYGPNDVLGFELVVDDEEVFNSVKDQSETNLSFKGKEIGQGIKSVGSVISYIKPASVIGGVVEAVGDAAKGAQANRKSEKHTVAESRKVVHKYTFILRLNDLKFPSFVAQDISIEMAEELANTFAIIYSNNTSVKKGESKKQIAQKKESQKQATQSYDKFEEIKKYKELLDSGIITQEEFEIKKKELLG